MASSRTPRRKTDPVETELLERLQRAVAQSSDESIDAPEPPATRSSRAGKAGRTPLILAYSGGRDSSTLVDLAVRLRKARIRGFADLLSVHVHHGLSAQANAWADHCAESCRNLDVPFEIRHVEVTRRGRGVEEAARDARYAALAAVAHEHGARFVLTAHHQDDRIETFLIQWLRGAGLEGLAGFPSVRYLGADGVRLLRPLMDATRAQIDRYVDLRTIRYVEDPSNRDTQLLRNALRLRVIPELEAARSGFRRAAARSIDLVGEAALALREIAAADLAACTEDALPGMLRLDRLAPLAPERRALVLRAWLQKAGVEAPSRARLHEILRQTLTARGDAKLLLRIGARELRRHRGLLLLREAAAAERFSVAIHWNGEAEIAVPAWRGVLRFLPTGDEGFAPEWLRAAPLELRARVTAERFKPHPTRPSKTLKRLFQDAGIPEFERAGLPLVWRDDRLIFVAGLGADVRLVDREGGAERIRMEWVPDATLLDTGQ